MNKSLYDIKWDQKYRSLVAFRKINPDRWPVETGKKLPERSLGKWCRDQRTAWKQDRLAALRYKALKAIRFPFYERTREGKWMKQYEKIKKYYKANSRYPATAESLSWISQQQLNYNRLSVTQRSLLQNIHFKKESMRDLRREKAQQHWADQLQKLKRFYARHKRLPARNDDSSLHSWLYHLRAALKTGNLAGNRKKLLRQTGIDIMTHTFSKKSWDERMADVLAFQRKTGTPSLRKKDKTYERSLYQWISIQKANYSKKELSPAQIRQLKMAKLL